MVLHPIRIKSTHTKRTRKTPLFGFHIVCVFSKNEYTFNRNGGINERFFLKIPVTDLEQLYYWLSIDSFLMMEQYWKC